MPHNVLPTFNTFSLRVETYGSGREIALGKRFLIIDKYTFKNEDNEQRLMDVPQFPIDNENFDDVMKQIDVQLSLDNIKNHFSQENQELSLELKFEKLSSFHPDSILTQLIKSSPVFIYWAGIKDSLETLKGYITDQEYQDFNKNLNEIFEKKSKILQQELEILKIDYKPAEEKSPIKTSDKLDDSTTSAEKELGSSEDSDNDGKENTPNDSEQSEDFKSKPQLDASQKITGNQEDVEEKKEVSFGKDNSTFSKSQLSGQNARSQSKPNEIGILLKKLSLTEDEKEPTFFEELQLFEPPPPSMYAVTSKDDNTSDQKKYRAKQIIYALQKLNESPIIRKVNKVDDELINAVINEINKKIKNQINEILTHTKYKQLEASWRGLDFVVSRTDFSQNIMIEILNCSKESLYEDFDKASSIYNSGLYQKVYFGSYNTPGAVPISSMVINHKVNRKEKDIYLIEQCSKVAAASHCPTFFPVGIDFFSQSSMDDFANKHDYSFLSKDNEWRDLRQNDDSMYIGLTFNDIVLRGPFLNKSIKSASKNLIHDVKTFQCEKIADSLHGSSALAMLTNVIRSAGIDGWLVNIKGRKDGKIENLPRMPFSLFGGESNITAEVIINDTQAKSLLEEGIIPLQPQTNDTFTFIPDAHSIYKPVSYEDDRATSSSILSCSISNVLLVSRIIHHLNTIVQEFQGTSTSLTIVLNTLKSWLDKLIPFSKEPEIEVLNKHPLLQYELELKEDRIVQGFFEGKLQITPHPKFKGIAMQISLVPPQ